MRNYDNQHCNLLVTAVNSALEKKKFIVTPVLYSKARHSPRFTRSRASTSSIITPNLEINPTNIQ